jgi:hypothetical protein
MRLPRTGENAPSVLAELLQRPAELYLGVIRYQNFCDDEHSIVVRATLKTIQQPIICVQHYGDNDEQLRALHLAKKLQQQWAVAGKSFADCARESAPTFEPRCHIINQLLCQKCR